MSKDKNPTKKAGRPSTFVEADVLKTTTTYLQECVEVKRLPIAADLARELDISKSTLYEWAKNSKPLSDTLGKLNSLQESMLVHGSLKNELNPTISKLMLHNHGYSDKAENKQENTGDININIKKI